jgi:hypothetical protein
MKYTAILTFAFLSACGSAVRTSDGPVITPPPQNPPARTFQTRDQGRRALLNDLAPLNLTPAARLPLNGTLTYDGHLNAALGNRDTVIGDLTVAVDLGRAEIRGAAGNFTNRFDDTYDGQLELFNGTFDETPSVGQYQSQAGVRGTLTDRFARDYAVSGRLEGDVLGSNAQGYEAVLSGAVKVNGGPQEAIKGGAVAVRR